MSMHKVELTEWEREGLELHRLPIGEPSQLSDTFRAGVQFATRKTTRLLLTSLNEIVHCKLRLTASC